MIDGMSIRKQADWDPKRKQMVGFVDLGSGSIENDAPMAREVIVILAVGIQGHWKVPVSYVLVDGISADVQSQLVISVIESLHSVGVRVVSLTMDGHPTNQRMADVLGCSVKPDTLKCFFPHPSDSSLNVYVFFDACHLLKNLRGALHSLQEISEPTFGTARWLDIVKLENLQGTEGLRAANKLTNNHVNFQQQKMKVKLAAQVLSSSVAKALEYASKLGLHGFSDSSGTSKFVALVDHMFDIFNSRTPVAKGYKGPIRVSNYETVKTFLQSAKEVLLNMTDMTGKKLCEGKRKIAVIGFAFNIDSLLLLSKDLLFSPSANLKYLLTYKLSQDHLELLFSAIRRFGGWNNNPSALQFASAYRSLLSHTGVISVSSVANCIRQDTTSILNVSVSTVTSQESSDIIVSPGLNFEEALCDHTYTRSGTTLSEFVDGVLEYIAGWVVRKVSKKIACKECSDSLVKKPVTSDSEAGTVRDSLVKKPARTSLLALKNNGGLYIPSEDVVHVVNHAEKFIRSNINVKSVKPNQWEKAVVTRILSDLPNNLFPNLHDHFLHTASGIDTHYTSLVRLICEEFVRLRRFHSINLTNIQTKGKSAVRHKLTKTILFKNQ
jgi:hypothetical protein